MKNTLYLTNLQEIDCRLAAFIGNFDVKQLSVTSNFKVEVLKEELCAMYLSAGVKGIQIVLLMTDS